MIGVGSQYATIFVHSEGRLFDGRKTYKVHLPPNIPAKDFWSFVAYDNQTRSFLQTNQQLPSISSNMKGIEINADTSIDIWFGPTTPAGHDTNWLQTLPGKSLYTSLRHYGPLQTWFDKSWRPGDIELVKDSAVEEWKIGAGFLQTSSCFQDFRKRGKENLFLITQGGKSMSNKKAAQQIHPLKTPRAAGVAGILFAVLFATSIILTRLAVPEDLTAERGWFTERRQYITIVLTLMPFAGIAFLWFVGVIRDLLGEYEDKFFSSIYIGSSLLFMAMIFVATALGSALVASFDFDRTRAVDLNMDVIIFSRAVMLQISNVYAVRMAGVFMTSLGAVWFRTRLVPRWLTYITFALALTLLVVISFSLWVTLVVPAWTLLVSLYILVANPQTSNMVQLEDTKT